MRFGQVFAREGRDLFDQPFASAAFFQESMQREAAYLTPPKDWLRSSNHLITYGRFVVHAGYGDPWIQFASAT